MNTYSAQIVSTTITNGTLTITVQYSSSDGTDTFTETINTYTAQADDWLSTQITNRLNTLNALSSFNSSIQTNPLLNNTLTSDPATLELDSTPIAVATPEPPLGVKS